MRSTWSTGTSTQADTTTDSCKMPLPSAVHSDDEPQSEHVSPSGMVVIEYKPFRIGRVGSGNRIPLVGHPVFL